MQMFEVALSRRMCCSRVWIAMRSARLPWLSRETPMMRPGILRTYCSLVAMNAACGPPKPIGTPKRWAQPTAMSAPHEAGVLSITSASGSHAATTSAPLAWVFSASDL